MTTHLRLKGSTWHFRMVVPQDLRAAAGRREVIRSTGTSDKAHARRVAARELVRTTDWFDDLRRQRAPSENVMVAVAQKALAKATRDLQGLDELALDDVLDEWRGYLDGYPIGPDSRQVITQVIQDNRLALTAGTEAHRVFSRKMARAHIVAAQEAMRRSRGDYTAHDVDDLRDEPAEAAGRPRARRGAVMASAAFDRWLEDNRERWSARTTQEYSGARHVFLEVLGDLPVADISRDDVRTLRETLAKLPVRWRQLSLSPREVLATDPVGPFLKPASRQKILQATKGMLEWSLAEGIVENNVAAGLVHVHDPQPAREKRDQWTVEALNVWFRSEVYSDPRTTWTHKAWLPLLGLFTGARLEELARLRTEDVHDVDGVPCVDIRWREGSRLKTAAATRLIPIHPELIGLGFLKYAKRVGNRGHLWPALRVPPPGRPWGSPFSQYFTRARRAAGVYDPKMDFHSLRGTFISAMLNAEVPLERVQLLVGHRAAGVTVGVYYKQVATEVLKRDLDRLTYPGLALPKK